jgi:outer membrane murein-binding lipoprotein Lpp
MRQSIEVGLPRAFVLALMLLVGCESTQDRAVREAAELEAELYGAQAEKYEDQASRSDDDGVITKLRILRENRAALRNNVDGMKKGTISSDAEDLANMERRLTENETAFASQLKTAKDRRAKLVDIRDQTRTELANKDLSQSKKGILQARAEGVSATLKKFDEELKLAE